MRAKKLLCAAVVLFLCSPGCQTEDARKYELAITAAEARDTDFAFMQYRSIFRDHPNSKFKEQALFALGEYYFFVPDYPKSLEMFNKFVDAYPDSEGKLFTFFYLLKMAKIKKNELLASDIEKKIIKLKQISLVFRDSKEYLYLSPLHRQHRAVFCINNIELYIEGEAFAKIFF